MKRQRGGRAALVLGVIVGMGPGIGACNGGGDPETEDEVGTVELAITTAPSGAQCLRLTMTVTPIMVGAASQVVVQKADITAGARTVMQFGGLMPNGSSVAVSGEAFYLPCAGIVTTSLPDWVAPAVSVSLSSQPAVVNLTFTRGSQVVVGADFPFGPLAQVKQASVGRTHTCAVMVDQTTRCWGSNAFGEIGDGGPTTPRLRPTVVSRTPTLEMAAGDGFTCSVLVDGTVNCWGVAIRNGNAAQQVFPTQVAGLTGVAHIAVSDKHACALLTDGTVRCWGENISGTLGNGTTTNSATPVNPNLKAIVQLSAGSASYALGADGTVWAWGDNTTGQLGDGTTVSKSVPKRIPGLTNIVQVAAGLTHACARTATGAVACWGDDAANEVGDGMAVPGSPRLVPTPIAANALVATDLVAGNVFTLIGTSTGAGFGWGTNGGGVLGNGTTTVQTLSATTIAGPFTIARVVTSSGASNACEILLDQSLRCWGLNDAGEVGDNTTIQRQAPVAVAF